MFILFGSKDRAVETDSGQFHCPNCNLKEEYGKKYVQDWFTLFFIPIFPISGKKNDHIECKKCESIYHLDVIDYKPALNEEEMESEYEKALKNVLCLMILADNKVEDEELDTVSDIYNKLTNNKNGNVNLGVAAPLFLPNDMSIIQSSNPSNLRGFNRLGSSIPSDVIGSSSG